MSTTVPLWKMRASLMYYLLITYCLSLCDFHELDEYDYWTEIQKSQAPILQFNHSVDILMKYMIPAGAECNPKEHFSSKLIHHSVRHGLLELTKSFFIPILNKMCVVIKDMEVRGIYQTYRCQKGRCDCPYDFLTWCRSEKKCKVMENEHCGEAKVGNTTIDLGKIFGCEAGTKCDGLTDENIERNSLKYLDKKTCQCLQKGTCGRARLTPTADLVVASSASVIRLF